MHSSIMRQLLLDYDQETSGTRLVPFTMRNWCCFLRAFVVEMIDRFGVFKLHHLQPSSRIYTTLNYTPLT